VKFTFAQEGENVQHISRRPDRNLMKTREFFKAALVTVPLWQRKLYIAQHLANGSLSSQSGGEGKIRRKILKTLWEDKHE
jgi:hypothetical protein